MSDLRPNVLTTDFDKLVVLGRSLIPKFAPEWTDHNLSDPGIMLIELLAWTAEAQIYSLARLRKDERWAFGALLGIERRGATPARGVIWPSDEASIAGGLLRDDAVIRPRDRSVNLLFSSRASINLTPAKLVGVQSELRDGSRFDHTSLNTRGEVAFSPFGDRGEVGDRLVLNFRGRLLAPGASGGDGALSLGVQVRALDAADGGDEQRLSQATLAVFLVRGDDTRQRLRVREDGTAGFSRTGVLLIDVSKAPEGLDGDWSIEIEGRARAFPIPPKILRVRANALPVEQVERITVTRDVPLDMPPDLIFDLGSAGVASGTEPSVKVRSQLWDQTADLSAETPDKRVFAFDHSRREIRFGNGVNGALPPGGAKVEIEYKVSRGDQGDVPASLAWTVDGASGVFGENLDPITGGAPALDLEELRLLARRRITTHAIVTSADLVAAALALPGLYVGRAIELPAARADASRTLVALRRREAADESSALESDPWLAEVRRRLAERIPLGQRLRVIAPTYCAFSIEATVVAEAGWDPQEIATRASRALGDHFRLIKSHTDDSHADDDEWALARPVSKLDARARLRNVDGVTAVKSCELLVDGRPLSDDVLKLPRTGLPLFLASDTRIRCVHPQSRSAT